MAHADHDHDAHLPSAEGDDLPAHGPIPEEPKSPRWLPMLGAAFFGLLLVWWLASPSEAEEAAAAAASAAASAEAAPSAPGEAAPDVHPHPH